MTTHRKLPLTHVDRIRKLRPEMWEYIGQEIAVLREKGWVGSVGSVDDIDSKLYRTCIEALFEKFVKDQAERMGAPYDLVLEHFRQSPEAKLLLNGLNQDYHNLLNFELAGRKTFYFSDSLTDNLLATELGVDAEMVRPPFDSSLFVFSSPLAIDAAFQVTGQTPTANDYRYPLSVFVVSLLDRTNPDFRKILMSVSHWNGLRLHMVIKREVSIRPGWKIEDALRTDWEALGDASDGSFMSHDGTTRKVTDNEFYTDKSVLFRLILNAVLYLGSNDAEIVQQLSGRDAALSAANSIKSHVKAKKARQEARKESELNYASVGDSTEPIYIRKGESGNAGDTLGGFREYAIRFLVRGHWRNQACGPEMSERRLVWIKPYYKGPDMAELVNRPYVVK